MHDGHLHHLSEGGLTQPLKVDSVGLSASPGRLDLAGVDHGDIGHGVGTHSEGGARSGVGHVTLNAAVESTGSR